MPQETHLTHSSVFTIWWSLRLIRKVLQKMSPNSPIMTTGSIGLKLKWPFGTCTIVIGMKKLRKWKFQSTFSDSKTYCFILNQFLKIYSNSYFAKRILTELWLNKESKKLLKMAKISYTNPAVRVAVSTNTQEPWHPAKWMNWWQNVKNSFISLGITNVTITLINNPLRRVKLTTHQKSLSFMIIREKHQKKTQTYIWISKK